MVVSMHMIYDFSSKQKDFKESGFIAGYILATLGRGLLHGDSENTGNKAVTIWKIRLIDFTAMQGAYMKLYIESFGAIYTKQLNEFIPMAFQPQFEVHAKENWRHLSMKSEPVYSSLRNWMFTEVSLSTDVISFFMSLFSLLKSIFYYCFCNIIHVTHLYTFS